MSDYVKRLAGPFTGEGDTTFTFGFFTYSEDEIYVGTAMSNDEATTILSLGVDYTVTLNDDQNAVPGGTVTLLTEGGLKAGEVLVIGSAMPYVKEIDLTNFSRFPPSQIDTEFNRLVIMIQQIVEETGRTLKVPATSSETPDEMIERLLAAQQTAQAAADAAEASAQAAEQSKEEAAEILEQVQDASNNADKILPYADDLATVADNIDSVQATGGSITNVNIVAGDLDSETYSADTDYGDYDDNSGSGEVEIPTGGNIVTVAQNIDAVQKVGQNMDSILAIEDKIDGLDQTVAEMEAAVAAAETAEAGAESAASQASQSATNTANQVTIAKDWAIKLDGKVQENGVEVDFSAKYWAQQAKGSSDAASAALDDVNDAKTEAQASATIATNKATEASGYATTASNAKTAAESARDAAIAAKEAAEDIAGEIGDPLGKAEAAQTYLSKTNASETYATKAEVTSGLSGKANTSHTHQQSDVEGLGTALAGKADSVHTHATSDITGLDTTLAEKANSVHTHEIADVTGLQTALDGKQPSGNYAAASHTHTASQVTDLGALGTKNEITAAELAASIDYGEYADA